MQDKIFYTVVLTSVLIAVIIIFFIISVIVYHRRYIALQKARLQDEIMIQEQERKRIANDIHDSAGPLLSAVKLYLQSVVVATEEDKNLLITAGNYVDESVNNLREISYNLLPTSLIRNGLGEAVKEYIKKLNDKQALKITFQSNGKQLIIKDHEIHVFRIFQEIIQNTIKHANASLLQLAIVEQQKHILIITIDDGDGFDVDLIKKGKGLGLKSIESRCEVINAKLSLESAIGHGSKYVIKMGKM